MPWIIAATTAIFCRIVQFLYYSDVDQIMRKSLLVSVFFEKKTLQKYVDMFLACPKSKVTIKLKFYYSNLKNAVETAKIAVDSCYVLRQFLTSLIAVDWFQGNSRPAIYMYYLKHKQECFIRYKESPIADRRK